MAAFLFASGWPAFCWLDVSAGGMLGKLLTTSSERFLSDEHRKAFLVLYISDNFVILPAGFMILRWKESGVLFSKNLAITQLVSFLCEKCPRDKDLFA